MGPRGKHEIEASCTEVEDCILSDESTMLTPESSMNSRCSRYRGSKGSLLRALGQTIGSRLVLVAVIVLLGTTVLLQLHAESSIAPTPFHQAPNPILKLKKSSSVEGMQHGAVASDHPVCSRMGTHILEVLGGNAVDAAITTLLCLGAANPASSGIGGGSFMVVHADRKHHDERWSTTADKPEFSDKRDAKDIGRTTEKITEVIDARETSPAAAYTNMFLDSAKPKASEKGGLAVAVLGELRGMELAHARHGSLPWSTLVEPVMLLARDGVAVTAHLAHDIGTQEKNIATYGLTELGSLLTKDRDGKSYLKEGQILKNTALAKTLEHVMQEGANAVYKGELAKNLAADIQEAGGILTESDLGEYQATLRSPLISEAFGFTVVGVPPPSSGGATIIGILRFLSGFQAPLASFAETQSIHRLVEATRHAFAIRMSLGDPEYFSDVVAGATSDLISGDYMEQLRLIHKDNETLHLSQFGGSKWAQLNDGEGQKETEDAHEGDRVRRLGQQDHRELYRPFGYLDDHGTTHLSVVDSEGNAVSVTSSVNTYFGSGLVSKSTGIVLNNQMDDFGNPGKPNYFGLVPSEGNYIQPRKKPLSSMAPTLFFKKNTDDNSFGDLFLSLGASGGPKIISSVVQVIINYALLGMPLFEAVAHPRMHDQLLYHGADVTCIEKCKLEQGPSIAVSNRTRAALEKRGHRLLDIDYSGTVQAVAVDLETGTLSAVSDIRKGGTPAGY